MVPIISVIKDSFQEYEPYQSLVVFVQGCNLKCKDCYNYEVVSNKKNITTNLINAVGYYLTPLHQGLVILGGEPTIWESNLLFDLRKIKDKFDIKIKIFTNGLNSKLIEKLNLENLVDAYSIDIKTVDETEYILGTKKFSLELYLSILEKSINNILNSKIDLELRTTKFSHIDIESVKNYVKNKFPNVKHIIQSPFTKR